MSANQTQIPVIQSDDANTTLLQQNTNKVLRNLSLKIDDLQFSVNQMTIVGELKVANLTVTQFKQVAGDNWLLCNGQSCVGTFYARLTANNVVPTTSIGGFNTYIRVD